MSRHKCNREDCPRDNTTGPKINCCKCKKMCYLKCYGFEKANVIDGNETVAGEKSLADGTVVVMFLSCMAFCCCDGIVTSTEIRSGLKMPPSRSTSKANTNDIANEMKTMKQMLESIQLATEANTAAITEMKTLSSKTEANMQKLADKNEENQMSFTGTPSGPPAMSYVQAFRNKMTTRANASPNQMNRMNSSKRPRTESPQREKSKFPEPKTGTKTEYQS